MSAAITLNSALNGNGGGGILGMVPDIYRTKTLKDIADQEAVMDARRVRLDDAFRRAQLEQTGALDRERMALEDRMNLRTTEGGLEEQRIIQEGQKLVTEINNRGALERTRETERGATKRTEITEGGATKRTEITEGGLTKRTDMTNQAKLEEQRIIQSGSTDRTKLTNDTKIKETELNTQAERDKATLERDKWTTGEDEKKLERARVTEANMIRGTLGFASKYIKEDGTFDSPAVINDPTVTDGAIRWARAHFADELAARGPGYDLTLEPSKNGQEWVVGLVNKRTGARYPMTPEARKYQPGGQVYTISPSELFGNMQMQLTMLGDTSIPALVAVGNAPKIKENLINSMRTRGDPSKNGDPVTGEETAQPQIQGPVLQNALAGSAMNRFTNDPEAGLNFIRGNAVTKEEQLDAAAKRPLLAKTPSELVKDEIATREGKGTLRAMDRADENAKWEAGFNIALAKYQQGQETVGNAVKDTLMGSDNFAGTKEDAKEKIALALSDPGSRRTIAKETGVPLNERGQPVSGKQDDYVKVMDYVVSELSRKTYEASPSGVNPFTWPRSLYRKFADTRTIPSTPEG